MSWRCDGRRISCLIVVAAALSWAAVGCTPVRRHAVLDFIFDGVPPYMTPEERALAQVEREEERRLEEERLAQRGRKHVKKLRRFVHGPFAAKECGRCHDLAASSGFRSASVAGVGSASSEDLAQAGRLRMPVNDLCARCHPDFSSASAREAGLWMHGPVASGWCVMCHQPHSSPNAALLVRAPSANLCTQCHFPETLLGVEEHRPSAPQNTFPPLPETDPKKARKSANSKKKKKRKKEILRVVADCIRCHDPHRGPDRMILRPRSEWQRAESRLEAPRKPGPAVLEVPAAPAAGFPTDPEGRS